MVAYTFLRIVRKIATYYRLEISRALIFFALPIVSWKQKKNKPSSSVLPKPIVHFLVLENEIYLKALRTAIISLLWFNPNMQLFLHLDSRMKVTLHKKIWFCLLKNSIEIREVSSTDWRISKLEIISKMSGTSDLFCDADLRFHESIPRFKGIQILINEGPKLKEFPYKPVLESLSRRNGRHSSISKDMLNTSIFSWGGISITAEEKEKLFEFFHFIDYGMRDSAKRRVAEQVTLSHFVQEFGYSWIPWKLHDYPKDGKVVDSTYTGNTGKTF